jgi:hypothetical protein
LDTERYVVLGTAHLRANWFEDVARWSTSGLLPIEFRKCVGVAEVLHRLRQGAACSAVLLDASTPGVDLDLIAAAHHQRTAVILVSGTHGDRAELSAAAAAVLEPGFSPDELMVALGEVARPIDWRFRDTAAETIAGPTVGTAAGRLVAVCGRGAPGSSVVAMALAQGLAARPGNTGSVVLADCTLNGDLGTYHDSVDVIPALQEFVEAHRSGAPNRSVAPAMLHRLPERGYGLLLGLRRRHDWTALQPAAITAAFTSLRGWFRWTVCDITADLEGEANTGSVDVEERHALARLALDQAAGVFAVGRPSLKGVRDVVRLVEDLVACGVPPARIQVVVNGSVRSRNARLEADRAIRELTVTALPAPPIHLPSRRSVEAALRCGDPLPGALAEPLATAAESHTAVTVDLLGATA